jgi:glucosamine kinase
MKLIIESGSTKTEWAFLQGHTSQIAETGGINPATQTSQSFYFDANFPKPLFASVTHTYYYGAGVQTDEAKSFVKNLLHQAGVQGHIEIHSDLLGAARACCQQNEGIVAILGTGSNICFFDGYSVMQLSPALGYILGDEGSGFSIGREIIRSYFYKTMPENIRKQFEKFYTVYVDDVLENTYKKPGNNAYIASFVLFLSKVDDPWKSTLLQNIFHDFIQKKLIPYESYFDRPIFFSGSVAHVFQTELQNCLLQYNLSVSEIFRKPMENLIRYHNV